MLDLAIVIAFILYAVGTGLRSRAAASKDLSEYFLAGRSLSGWRAGLSMAATQFSADTPLLIAGLVAAGGVFLIWQIWVFALAFLMLGFIFGGPWQRSGVTTDAELCELRYDGSAALYLRVFKAVYYGVVLNCAALAFVLVATVRITETFLPWHEWLPTNVYQAILPFALSVFPAVESVTVGLGNDFATTNAFISLSAIILFTLAYATTGGLRSVVATDVVQFGISVLAITIFTVILVQHLGGIDEMLNQLRALYGHALSDRILSFSPMEDGAVAGFIVIVAINWFFQYSSDGTGYLAQRAMACRSEKDVQVAILVFSWAHVILRGIVWSVMAIGLLVLIPSEASDLVNISDAVRGAREAAFPQAIGILLPAGLLGLMLTGLLAALASTLDTHLNWGAGYWANDIYSRLLNKEILKREPGASELVWVARLSNIVIIFLAIIIMGHLGSIAAGWKVFLLLGAGTASALVLRWTWERANAHGEIAAIVFSIVGSILLLEFFPGVELEWLRLTAMAVGSTAVVIIVTLLTQPTSARTLDEFYRKVSPPGFWPATAKRVGDAGSVAPMRLALGAGMVAMNGGALFLALIGFGELLLPTAGRDWLLITSCIGGALILAGAVIKVMLRPQP